MLWLLVDPRARQVAHAYRVIGTGWDFDPEGWRYVGTLQTPPFVWHVFWGEGA